LWRAAATAAAGTVAAVDLGAQVLFGLAARCAALATP